MHECLCLGDGEASVLYRGFLAFMLIYYVFFFFVFFTFYVMCAAWRPVITKWNKLYPFLPTWGRLLITPLWMQLCTSALALHNQHCLTYSWPMAWIASLPLQLIRTVKLFHTFLPQRKWSGGLSQFIVQAL